MADVDDWDVSNTADLIDRSNENDDDNVKDAWDEDSDDEAAKKPAEPAPAPVKNVVKKKTVAEKAAEKEAERKRLEEETRLKLAEANLSPQDIAARNAAIRKQQEDSDFAMAADLFSDPSAPATTASSSGSGVIDAFEPETAESFIEFRRILTDKIRKYEKSQFYPIFLQSFFQDLAINLNSEDVRKCGAILNTLSTEKSKKEKEAVKAKPKAKGKFTLKATKKDDAMSTFDDTYDDGMDDLL